MRIDNNTSLCLLILMLPCLLMGCGAQPEVETPVVFLGDDNVSPPDYFVKVPDGTGVKHFLTLGTSKDKLTALTVASSCGCASTDLSQDRLTVGERSKLEVCFDPAKAGLNKTVNLFVRSKEQTSTLIPIRYSVDESMDDWMVKAVPSQFSDQGDWEEGLSWEFESSIKCGNSISVDELKVYSSSDLVEASLGATDEQGKRTVKVEIRDMPVGPVNETVTVEFDTGEDIYYAKINIEGVVRAPLEFYPSSIVAKKDADFSKTFVDVSSRRGEEQPSLKATGEWSIDRIERTEKSTWRVFVSPERSRDSGVAFGCLQIEGDWVGDKIQIPLSANF